MFDAIIRYSLRRPWIVLLMALLAVAAGVDSIRNMPVDVLPELTAPTVTVVTEAHGLSPEEVEQTVTIPLEQALNGAAGLRRIRSSSAIGRSLIWVEFEWDVDPLVARQVVSERLRVAHGAREEHPEPVLAPASSIMGEIMFVGLQPGEGMSARELRTIADWDVRRPLLSVRDLRVLSRDRVAPRPVACGHLDLTGLLGSAGSVGLVTILAPAFGLVAVDRATFVRTPKPSLAWLGAIARSGQLPGPAVAG